MLDNRQGPVLIDVLKQRNYQWRFFSSQKFSYPEFEKTVLADVPEKDIQSFIDGKGWQRDRKNVADVIEFIENRDIERPFMTYMFFESPHARYYFPPESVIREPYLEEFNYATMDTESDMAAIFNRYVNSVHHLDSQVKRLLDYLTENELLENTIVLLTGDHGEEFMENGHWGHGSTFSEQQVLVPMVLWVPGQSAQMHNYMTSHLDIPATLLPLLGVSNDAFDYSLGYDMSGETRRRYAVAGHWHTLGFINENYKASFAMAGSGYHDNQVTTADDKPVEDTDIFYKSHQSDLLQIMKEISRFSSP
jgi:membrane-anchored protein YejM (alkaline phosphatase superfamily)